MLLNTANLTKNCKNPIGKMFIIMSEFDNLANDLSNDE